MNEYAVRLCEGGEIAVDDTILVKDALCTAGSRILEGYQPLFSAEAVERLEKKGLRVAGKTHVGEFGLDLVGEFSHYAPQEGALKGAAAELVANKEVKAALAVDVNGAPRRAAALSGVCFVKPTYGTVSRYGVISTAASGEQLGVYAADVDGAKEILSLIAGHDAKDGTSLPQESYDYACDKPLSQMKVAVVKALWDKAGQSYEGLRRALEAKGVTVEEIDADFFPTANVAWQILMSAETCNNLSRYDGVKFGRRAKEYKDIDQLYVNSRTEGLSFLTKTVILYGSDVLSKSRYEACYHKSLQVRRVMADAFAALAESYDALLMPACSQKEYASYDIHEAFDKVFEEGEFTCLANLIGIPALVCEGAQWMGKHFGEGSLFALAKAVERKGE